MGDRRGDHRGYGPSSRRREEDDGWGRRYGRREEAPQISDRRGDPRSRYDERRDERRDECRDERRDERPRDDARRPDERRAPGRRDERRRYARPREEPARQEDEGDDEEEESEEEEEEEEVCANAAPAKQRAVAPQAPPPVAAGGKVSAPPLTVSRCQNDTISDIIAGVYLPAHMNHGKVVYKKQEKSRGLDVLIYYWDDRDGPELCGWWFGPNVGGDQVWAYHPSRTAATPPASEWNVPHDGPIDSSFSVAMRNAAARAPSGEKASPSGEKAPAERRRPEGRSSRAREESAPVGPPRSRARSRTAGDRNSEAERSRREGSQPPKVEELSSAPPGGSHAYFLDAYNRRRQERLREQRQKEDEPPPARAAPAPPPPPSRREEPPRQPDRRDREPDRRDREPDRRDREPDRRDREPDRRDRSDRKEEVPSQRMVRQLQDMKEVMERQAEEERRQVEELKRRADERKRMEEEFQRKMKDILDKPRPELPGDKDDRDRRRRGDHEDRSRDRGERARERRNDRTENWDREDGRRPERRRGREDEDERASKRRREDGDRDEERRRKQDEERRRHDERRKEDEGERKRREEQERIKREEEKRRKEEDMRRREEELQRKRDEKRRLEDEERKKTEEERRAKLAEERRRDEERRKQEEERNKEEMERRRREEWQRHEEELQRRAEEDKRKAEDEQKRREEEAKVLRQQQATLSVLRVLQKLSNASPDDFESLNKELEEVLNTELPETGAQQEILKAEADRVLEYAKQYVEQVREQQKKWEELREQQAKKQEELEATARAAIQELQASVTSAEAAAEGAHYTAAPLAGEHEMEVVEVLKLCRTVEKTGKSAMTSCQACLDLVAEKKATIEEAENIRAEAQQVISQVQPRVQAATRLVSDALAKAKDNKERIAKRLATAKRTEMRAKLFAKYDEDGDGRWNRKEIAAYAKGEFNFDMPEENLDRILRQVCGGEGASIDCLQILKVSVGIARDEDKGKVKRAERLERERIEREERERREAELQGRVEEVSGDIKELQAELQKLDPEIHAAEGLSEALVSEANSDQLKDAEEARVRLKAIESIVQTTHAAIAAVRLKAQELSAKVAEDKEIADLMITDFAAVASKTEAQDFALRKALSFAEQARQLVLNRAFEKYETLRMEVASKLRVCIELQGGKPDDLYAAITTAGSNVTKKSIKAYLEANQSLVEDEKLDKVFPGPPLAEKDKEAVEISKEDFMRVVRIFYKVVKEIVLSDNLLIEQSDQLRRMDVGEIIEVFQGPMLDPSVGVYRIHGKALKDGIVGWATVAGNQGITFLMPDNNLTSR